MLYSCTHIATVGVKGLIRFSDGNNKYYSYTILSKPQSNQQERRLSQTDRVYTGAVNFGVKLLSTRSLSVVGNNVIRQSSYTLVHSVVHCAIAPFPRNSHFLDESENRDISYPSCFCCPRLRRLGVTPFEFKLLLENQDNGALRR